jgi:hypothetical protein
MLSLRFVVGGGIEHLGFRLGMEADRSHLSAA